MASGDIVLNILFVEKETTKMAGSLLLCALVGTPWSLVTRQGDQTLERAMEMEEFADAVQSRWREGVVLVFQAFWNQERLLDVYMEPVVDGAEDTPPLVHQVLYVLNQFAQGEVAKAQATQRPVRGQHPILIPSCVPTGTSTSGTA